MLPVGEHTVNRYEDLDLDKVRRLAHMGMTDNQMASIVGVSYSTWRKWRRTHEDFDTILKSWESVATENVEKSLYQRAIGMKVLEEKAWNSFGQIITHVTEKEIAPDVKACQIWLENKDPERWRNRALENITADLGSLILQARERARAVKAPLIDIEDEVEDMLC